MAFYDLTRKVMQHHFCLTLLVETVPNWPRFQGRGCGPHLFVGGVTENLQPF